MILPQLCPQEVLVSALLFKLRVIMPDLTLCHLQMKLDHKDRWLEPEHNQQLPSNRLGFTGNLPQQKPSQLELVD